MAPAKLIQFVSQYKALYRSLHTEFMEIGGHIFNMWLQYRYQSIKLSHWHPEVNFESLQLLDKEVEVSGLDGPNISSHCFVIFFVAKD